MFLPGRHPFAHPAHLITACLIVAAGAAWLVALGGAPTASVGAASSASYLLPLPQLSAPAASEFDVQPDTPRPQPGGRDRRPVAAGSRMQSQPARPAEPSPVTPDTPEAALAPPAASPVAQASTPQAAAGPREFGVEVGAATAGKPRPPQGAEFGQP